jgi:hypothetical protein
MQISHIVPVVTLSLGILLTTAGCDDMWRHYTGGDSGRSFRAGDEVVILNNGYRRGEVTWVVTRSWPAASTPAERLADARLVRGRDGEFRVRHPGGELAALAPRVAYVFTGDRLTTFPLRMREADFIAFPRQLSSYAEVETFLRRYEGKDGSP